MKKVIHILSGTSFLAALYWVYTSHQEVEPYVTAIGLLAGFLLTFENSTEKEEEIKRPRIYQKAVGIEELEANHTPKIIFEFENVGGSDALELTIGEIKGHPQICRRTLAGTL